MKSLSINKKIGRKTSRKMIKAQKGKPKGRVWGERLKLMSNQNYGNQNKTLLYTYKIGKKFRKLDDSMCWQRYEVMEILVHFWRILDACSSSKEQAGNI